jgi:hypothetical protein
MLVVATPDAFTGTADEDPQLGALNVTVPTVTGLPPAVTVAVSVVAWAGRVGLTAS